MNSLSLLRYDLADGVEAFSTMRQGGVSQGAYASMNINAYCGDSPLRIADNKSLLARELGIGADAIIMPHQVHRAESAVIDGAFFSLTDEQRRRCLEGKDIIMTSLRRVCVGVSTADCVPILLCDDRQRAVCAVHAGWRGTVLCVVQEALRMMRLTYGTLPCDVSAAIGPCISLGAFEVGDEVYEAFRQAGFPMESIARREAKWHIDLPECNRLQLQSMGVQAERVHLSGICTYTDNTHYFSARRQGQASGRIFSALMLR